MLRFLRKALPYLTVVAILALAYDGWIFYSRWNHARETERQARDEEASRAQKTLDLVGGGGLKILSFYATPGTLRRGERANLCYGVSGAKTVRIEPPVQELHPALTYCFAVTPAGTTEYRLVAEDAAGQTTQQALVLQVKP
jgi:hypothetical protein